MTIVEIQVFWRDNDDNLNEEKQPPSSQNTADIKLDVARIVKRIKDTGKAKYYYMVLKVRKSSGEFGYRTMIPKTVLS